jgi:hypothetical protein
MPRSYDAPEGYWAALRHALSPAGREQGLVNARLVDDGKLQLDLRFTDEDGFKLDGGRVGLQRVAAGAVAADAMGGSDFAKFAAIVTQALMKTQDVADQLYSERNLLHGQNVPSRLLHFAHACGVLSGCVFRGSVVLNRVAQPGGAQAGIAGGHRDQREAGEGAVLQVSVRAKREKTQNCTCRGHPGQCSVIGQPADSMPPCIPCLPASARAARRPCRSQRRRRWFPVEGRDERRRWW